MGEDLDLDNITKYLQNNKIKSFHQIQHYSDDKLLLLENMFNKTLLKTEI